MDDTFDLLTGDHFHVILHPDREHALIFNRLDKAVTTINYDDARELINVKLIGRIYGIVGCFLDKHLVLIKNRSKVGTLYEPNSKTDHDVYVINQVQVIDLRVTRKPKQRDTSERDNEIKDDATLNTKEDGSGIGYPLTEMKNSESFSSLPITINSNSYLTAQRVNYWNPFKLANSLKPMMPTQFLKFNSNDSSYPSDSSPVSSSGADLGQSESHIAQIENTDKRLVDEMVKLFNNTNSFYYSPTLDLTNRFSRKKNIQRIGNKPMWKEADERFFWNKHMLKDLIALSEEDNDANHFICVILQGFIAIQLYTADTFRFTRGLEKMVDELSEGSQATSMNFLTISKDNCDMKKNPTDNDHDSSIIESIHAKFSPRTYQLALISRRSVFQAGTRYLRRGCDENGHCANFVETEQIFKSNQHYTSLVLLRGSIPLFWHQSGFNYRPPPILSRSPEENHIAFSKHFIDLFHQYGTEHIISVDCTEQTGREKILHDAFQWHIDKFRQAYNQTGIIQFDYHKYCRGRQCTDAQIEEHMKACGLTEQTLKDIKYYWNDGDVVLEQAGIFRVNCLDCSDRTNVVQRILALQILDLQLARLGIIAPDASLEENECKRIMQSMWSANGNVLSTQYCGTRALFGGDRKLSGYIKDTYSSASRYYISKFRDVYRQAAIDAMLGVGNPDAANLEQYELLSFDPILAGKAGGAMLKDVGSRVTNRLARLKGRFNNVRSSAQIEPQTTSQRSVYSSSRFGITETRLNEPMGDMSIDWPSSESVNSPGGLLCEKQQPAMEAIEAQDVFACYANCDDNFQDDDEFSQLMLSIDVAELQKLREEEEEEAHVAIEDIDRSLPKSGEEKTRVNMQQSRVTRKPEDNN